MSIEREIITRLFENKRVDEASYPKKLEALRGKFWIKPDELKSSIESLGFDVEDLTDYDVVVVDSRDTEYVIPIVKAGSSYSLKI